MRNYSQKKDRKYMFPVSQFVVVPGQATYPINSSSITELEFLARKQHELFNILALNAQYTISLVSGVYYITIVDTELLAEITDIQVVEKLIIESGQYDDPRADLEILRSWYNKLQSDYQKLQRYTNELCFIVDSKFDDLVLPSLKPSEVWTMNDEGDIVTTPIKILEDELNKFLEDLYRRIEEYINNYLNGLDISEEIYLRVKAYLDDYLASLNFGLNGGTAITISENNTINVKLLSGGGILVNGGNNLYIDPAILDGVPETTVGYLEFSDPDMQERIGYNNNTWAKNGKTVTLSIHFYSTDETPITLRDLTILIPPEIRTNALTHISGVGSIRIGSNTVLVPVSVFASVLFFDPILHSQTITYADTVRFSCTYVRY